MRTILAVCFLIGCSSSSEAKSVTSDASSEEVSSGEVSIDAVADTGVCPPKTHAYYSTAGCGLDAKPECWGDVVGDATTVEYCACDGTTHVASEGPPFNQPWMHLGACEGVDAPAPSSDCHAAPVSGKCAAGCFEIAARPWLGDKSCFGPTEVVGCDYGADGGTAITCGVEKATGRMWEFPTTQLPQDGAWRFCTDAEKGTHPLDTFCDAG